MIKIVVIGGLIVFLVRKFIYSPLAFYCSNIDNVKNHAIIKFDDFVKYYNINPSKWDLRDMMVGYTPKTVYDLDADTKKNYYSEFDVYRIWHSDFYALDNKYLGKIFYRFSFIDSLRYKKWYENMDNAKKQKEAEEKEIKMNKQHREDIISLLEGVQKDIDKLRKQSQDELKQAMDTMEEVKERIGQYEKISYEQYKKY